MYWTSSSILLRETVVEGYLTNSSPLRIGSGREPPLGAVVDLAVLRIPYKDEFLPYIPGSSIKGIFRSYTSSMAKSAKLDVCTGLAKETCMDLKQIEDPELGEQTLGRYVELKLRSRNSKDAMDAFFKKACLMCKIFGSLGYAGKIRFSDAYPLDENGNPLPVRLGARTGIAINRRTGAVMEHALYTVEYVEPGAKFRFKMECTNLPNYALGLLGIVLRMINEGQVKIGGFKTRGFGEVKFENIRFKNREFPQSVDGILKSLEEGLDSEVNLQGIVRIEDGWQVAEDHDVWSVLEKLKEAWINAISRSRSH
ncbi:MAG: CRISPR-associated RAMP protein [Thaumarchaeota archaeon]|nr:CRISPR-associated RAMP protein [Nitrososphaerota archaeon]